MKSINKYIFIVHTNTLHIKKVFPEKRFCVRRILAIFLGHPVFSLQTQVLKELSKAAGKQNSADEHTILKVVVRAEILHKDFLQTPGNHCW